LPLIFTLSEAMDIQVPTLNLALPPKFKKYLGPSILALTSLIGVLFVFQVMQPAISSQRAFFAEKTELSRKKDVMAKTLANLRAIDYSQEQQRLSSVELSIPSKNDLLQVMSFIESLAKSLGLEVIANKGTAGNVQSPSKKLSGYAIQATFSGDYEKLREFLRLLYQSKRAIGTSSIVLAGREDGKKISLTVTFFLPVSSEAVKVDAFNTAVTSLSSKEEELIQDLNKREIFIEATTSAVLGRSNPFALP